MGEPAPPAPDRRDGWDKAAIVLQPVGGLLTALAVAVLGFWTSSWLRDREARESALRERMQTSETNARLYSELISKREESESALRKDMFTSIINSFLGGGGGSLEQKVLNLELLVYNFHESLNLKPLFLHLARAVRESPQRAEYLARLNRVAEEVSKKQMLVIEEGGANFDASVDGKTLALVGTDGERDGALRRARSRRSTASRATSSSRCSTSTGPTSRCSCASPCARRSRPAPRRSRPSSGSGHFDFPMIDNTRLPHDQRLAVVLNNFDAAAARADLTLAYFPGKYAGLREKPYYDEVAGEAAGGDADYRGSRRPRPRLRLARFRSRFSSASARFAAAASASSAGVWIAAPELGVGEGHPVGHLDGEGLDVRFVQELDREVRVRPSAARSSGPSACRTGAWRSSSIQ